MNDYKKLEIWKRSISLTSEIYDIVAGFPVDERFGLSSQLKRCVVSIPSNIAEGAGRGSKKEFGQFINYAYGSTYELETQLIIAFDQNFIEEERFKIVSKEIDEIQKMIYSFKKTLN